MDRRWLAVVALVVGMLLGYVTASCLPRDPACRPKGTVGCFR